MKTNSGSKFGRLLLSLILAVIGFVYWFSSGSDFFDAGSMSWLWVSASASSSAFFLFLSLRGNGVLKNKACMASVLVWSFWMLGLPGIAYLGILILLPLEWLLSALVVDFGASIGMTRSLVLTALTRWTILLGLVALEL